MPGVARIEGKHLGVRDMRRRRESPILVLLLGDRWFFGPARTEIAAHEKRGGLGAGIERDAAILAQRGDGVGVREPKPAIARLPAFAVGAPKNAVAMGAGESDAIRQQAHGADVMARKRRGGKPPSLALCRALEDGDAGGGGDENPGRRAGAVEAALTIGRET